MPRWSTFTVLCLLALAVGLGFALGTRGRTGASAGRPERAAQKIISPRAQALALDSEAVPAPPAPEPESAEARCLRLLAQPATPGRNDALLAAIASLAEQNPLGAIALARNETSSRLRQQWLEAAFRGWGKTAPATAADWILAQPADSLDANAAIAAVLKGAVQNPGAARQLTEQLVEQHPDQARDYGDALIYALGQTGDFQRAADFAAAGSGAARTEWLAAAYGNWANYQPQTAAASALQLADATRGDALDAVISTWGGTDPQGLANFAENELPAGDQKTRALAQALVFWAGNSPLDVANWINQFGPSPAFDQGEAAIATQQDVMKQPEIALDWAQAIADTALRSRTIAAVIETWWLSNPGAALSYLQTSADVLPEDRTGLVTRLDRRE